MKGYQTSCFVCVCNLRDDREGGVGAPGSHFHTAQAAQRRGATSYYPSSAY